MTQSIPLRLAVFISGSGSNLQAIIRYLAEQRVAATIVCVVSNKADAPGLQYARQANIPTVIVAGKDYDTRAAYDAELLQRLSRYQPELLVLAGFMRILGPEFVNHFCGRLINIHPSLLPNYRGLNTHARVLADQVSEHGISIHFVNADLDAGPLICQAKLQIAPDESQDSLSTRIHAMEHILYPRVIHWFADRRISLQDQQVLLDGQALPASGQQFTESQLLSSRDS